METVSRRVFSIARPRPSAGVARNPIELRRGVWPRTAVAPRSRTPLHLPHFGLMLHQSKLVARLRRPSGRIGWSARAEAAAATGSASLRRLGGCSLRPYEEVRLVDVAADAGSPSRRCTRDSAPRRPVRRGVGVGVKPEGTRRDRTPVGDVARAVRTLYDSYELEHARRPPADGPRGPDPGRATDDRRGGAPIIAAGWSAPSRRCLDGLWQARERRLVDPDRRRPTCWSGSCCDARWSWIEDRPNTS